MALATLIRPSTLSDSLLWLLRQEKMLMEDELLRQNPNSRHLVEQRLRVQRYADKHPYDSRHSYGLGETYNSLSFRRAYMTHQQRKSGKPEYQL